MSRLETLIENRSKLTAEFDALADTYTKHLETRSLTDDEKTAKSELRSRIESLDEAIDEATADEKRSKTFEEARSRMAPAAAAVEDHITVGAEPTVYGEGSSFSFYADMAAASHPAMRDHFGASKRLEEHRSQVDGILSFKPASKEARAYRGALREMSRGAERRAIDTGAGSMGAFAPPVYLLADYAPYRLPGRAFADACHAMPLPDTGMVVSVPRVTSPAGAGVQTAQNTANGFTEQDPQSTYASANVQTAVGNINASQQYLDRVGPGVGGDIVLQDALTRSLNQQIDQIAIQAAGNAAGQLSYTGTFAGSGLLSQIGKAKAAIKTAAGVVSYPNATFWDPELWEFFASRTDSSGRPYVLPTPAGQLGFNPQGFGADSAAPEGFTGYTVGTLPAFNDQNLDLVSDGAATPSNSHQVLVGDLSLVWFMQGTPVPRVLPQPSASELTVLIQQYVYLAVLLPYPNAVQVISGSALAESQIVW